MFKESEYYRRRQRDDADSSRNVWLEYERRKRLLEQTAGSADEYEVGIRRICTELGI